jgi:hypothetical protein
MTIFENYKQVIRGFYQDESYTLSRACVICDFTHRCMETYPESANDIEIFYRNFLYEHYPMLYLAMLILW